MMNKQTLLVLLTSSDVRSRPLDQRLMTKRAETATWHGIERRCWWPATSETSVQTVHQLLGLELLCCRHRCTVSPSVYWTRCGTSSQCRSECSSSDRLKC